MHLFFIRHGQSQNNALWDRTGSSRGRNEDPELTEAGVVQARLLAEYIQRMDEAAQPNVQEKGAPTEAGLPASRLSNGMRRDFFCFTHLYTSLMVRSVMTGTAVAKTTGKALTAWVDIHETGGIFLEDPETGISHGLPGKPRSFFEKHYNHLVLPDALDETGWWNRPFENDLQRPLRAERVLAELLQRHGGTNDRVALVSHGAFYNHLMRAIFGGDGGRGWWLMYNTAITRVDFTEGERPTLVFHNRTDHLPEYMLT